MDDEDGAIDMHRTKKNKHKKHKKRREDRYDSESSKFKSVTVYN